MTPIVILMAVRNGGGYLQAQLDSIAGQSHGAWRLLVSDDRSQDESARIVQQFAARCSLDQVQLISGPCKGVAANFRHLIRLSATLGAGENTALAFCDQDDVWHPDHLSRKLSLAKEAAAGTDAPMIAGGRLAYVDETLAPLGLSRLPRHPPAFGNALVQNVISGNTMLLTPAAARLLVAAEAEAGPFVLHDWWAYQIVTGAGGGVAFDPEPTVLYRQHGGNLVGSNSGLAALPRRLARHLRGDYAGWHRVNAAALQPSTHRFTAENRAALEAFSAALDAPLPERIRQLRAAGIWHQTRIATAAFWASVLLGLA